MASRAYFGAFVVAGAGVMGTGRFVFSTVDVSTLKTLVLGAAAGLVAGDCGVEDGVVACGAVAGIPAGGPACSSFCSNSLVVRRW